MKKLFFVFLLLASLASFSQGSVTVSANGLQTVQTLTDAATVTWTISSGVNASVTLGGDRTLAISNPDGIRYGTLKVIQDGTGSRSLTPPAGTKFPGGLTSGKLPLSTGAGKIDIVTWYYDGTNYFFNVLKDVQ